jgi:hypothetical protein
MATLYQTCPKCGAASAGLDICAACGLIFAKYLKAKFAGSSSPVRPANAELDGDEDSRLAQLKEALFYIPEQVDPTLVYARAVLLAAIAFYGARLALMTFPLGKWPRRSSTCRWCRFTSSATSCSGRSGNS